MKRRKKAKKSTSSSKKSSPKKETTMDLFIEKLVLDQRIRPWQRKEIAAFFKHNKLLEKEDPKSYEEVFKKY